VAERIKKARGAFGPLNTVCRSTAYSNNNKIRIFNIKLKFVLLYGCETWKLTKTIIQQLQVLVNRCIRRILKIFRPVQISNQELWTRTKQRPIELKIRQRKWGWLDHTLHRPPGDIAKAALEWNPHGEPDPEADPEQHGAEQSSKRLDIKEKYGKKSKYSPKTVSDGETL